MENTAKGKILISTSTFGELDSRPVELLRAGGYEVINNPFKRKLTGMELAGLLKEDVLGLIAGLEVLDRETMRVSRLKVISRCGSGLSNVDLNAARDLNIKVFSTPDAPVTAVSELTVGALISLLRSLPQMDRAMRGHKWKKHIGSQVSGKNIAIIGLGRIGKKTAELLKGFGAVIKAVDPLFTKEINGFQVISFDEALAWADVIILHSSGNFCVLGAREFKIMKKGMYILNPARGELIDEDSLISALDDGTVKGAWIDAFIDEPYSGALCGYAQVILSPHAGSYTKECRARMELEAAANVLKGLREDI